MWLSNTGCEEVVQAAWTSVGDFGSEEAILAKVEKCGKDLSWWNKKIFGNVKRELDRLKKNLAKVEIEAMTSGNNFRIGRLRGRLRCFWREKLLCGLNGQESYGRGKEIKIPNIFIVVLQGDIGKM